MTSPKRPASRHARAGTRPTGAQPRRDKQRPRPGRPMAPSRPSWRERPGPLLAALAAIVVVVAVVIFGGRSIAGSGARPAPSGCPTSQPAPLGPGDTRTVTIETPKGSMVIKVQGKLAPVATGNFVALAGCGFYDGLVFHRAATLPDGTPFVIQGGDPNRNGSGGPGYTIADDAVTTPYRRGVVAMARTQQPHSEGSQFFIVLSDLAASSLTSANNYAILGEVTSGMEVADAIYGAADKETPTNPVPMTKVTVTSP
jgi:peptidyl-prolyl cis-trans isomerase B (cyclophilin B)